MKKGQIDPLPEGTTLKKYKLIRVNDLVESLTTNAKLLPNDTSLFSVVYDNQTSANNLKKDLEKRKNWAF